MNTCKTASKLLMNTDRENLKVGTKFDGLVRCAEGRSAAAMAVTWGNPGDATLGHKRHSAAIQLCKTTVDNVAKGWFNMYQGWRKNSFLGQRAEKSLNAQKFGYKPIGKSGTCFESVL
jgi:hypothetical protein